MSHSVFVTIITNDILPSFKQELIATQSELVITTSAATRIIIPIDQNINSVTMTREDGSKITHNNGVWVLQNSSTSADIVKDFPDYPDELDTFIDDDLLSSEDPFNNNPFEIDSDLLFSEGSFKENDEDFLFEESVNLPEININSQTLPIGDHIIIPSKDTDMDYRRDADTIWDNTPIEVLSPYQKVIKAIDKTYLWWQESRDNHSNKKIKSLPSRKILPTSIKRRKESS